MSEYIKIGDKDVIVGLDWADLDGKNKRQVVTDIKKEAKETNNYYGYFTELKNKTSQYVLFPNSNDGVVVGSAIIADVFKDTVFIKKIDTGNINTTKYWVCAVDNDGLIFEDGDRIFNDEEELELFINDMVSLYEMKVVSFANSFDFSNIKVDHSLDNDFFDSYLSDPSYKIKQLVRDTSINRKYLLGGIAALFLSVGGFLFFYEDQLYNDIVNEVVLEDFSIMSKELKKYQKEIKRESKRKTFTQEEITELGKQSFKDYYDSHFFNNKEIINNILLLDNYLERYAMEWELEKLIYDNNKFVLVYKKIQGSIGVFTDLDNYILNFSKENGLFNVKPVALADSGKKRVYEVDFGENINQKKFLARKLEEENKVSKKEIIEDLEDKAKKIKSDAMFLSENVRELNIFQRLFTNDVLVAYEEIEMLIEKSKKVYEKINEEISKEEPPILLKEGSLSGSELKYVEISQRDSLFLWSYPKSKVFFPEEKLLKVRGKNAASLKPFARSYQVELASIEEISKGAIYMEEALTYLDKPYIIINSVEFSKDEDMWVINAEIFEKVYEHKPEENKEDKKKR